MSLPTCIVPHLSMRHWLLFILSLVSLSLTHAQETFLPFPTNVPPSFSFDETYRDDVIADPDFPGEFLTQPRGKITITATCSLDGFDVSDPDNLDVFSPYSISIGEFTMSGILGDDPEFDPSSSNHNRSVTITIPGINVQTAEEVTAGTLRIEWNSARVIYTLSLTDADLLSVDMVSTSIFQSGEYWPDVNASINEDTLLAKTTFGPFSTDARTCYFIGSTSSKADARVVNNISDAHIFGAIDSVAPTITISQPAPNALVTTNEATADGKYNIVGTVSDFRTLFGQTLSGVVDKDSVEVQIGTLTNPGVFQKAQVDDAGNWILPNAQLEPGKNRLAVRAMDIHGNIFNKAPIEFTYTKQGNISVTASATGYSMTDSGKTAGTVSGMFPIPNRKKTPVNVKMVVGQSPFPFSLGGVTAGQIFTVKAKAAPGSVFNGWVGKINNVTVLTAVTETLNFETKPNLVLTANFVPDPFITNIRGGYAGLVDGLSVKERGLFNLNLSKSGAFTGSLKIGAVLLPLKGKILGSGFWTTTIQKKGGLTYTITLNLTLSQAGDRQINGTITSTGINSTIVADLNDWHKAKGSDPGKLSDAYAGFYNVLLPAANTNTDPNFPRGTGYGRVNIGKLGTVKFVGKTGDGTAVTTGTKLVKRNSGAVVFPLFFALDKSLGSISGVVTYNNTLANSDLTATLDWSEPLTKDTDPEAFTGKVALHGSLYVKPASGERVILDSGGGIGNLTLNAPAYTKPSIPSGSDLTLVFNSATLDATRQSLGPLGPELVKLNFDSKTGLFSGSYKDAQLKKTIPFSGVASRKANNGVGEAGGVFKRGNRSGNVRFGP